MEDIIEGNEDKYKAVSVRQQQDPEAAAARYETLPIFSVE